MSASALLRDATRRLSEAGVPDAANDARRLLAHVLNVDPGRLTLMLTEPMAAEKVVAFSALVARRAAREPVSQIVGRRTFYGRSFAVDRHVLDPRPETEMLIEAALAEPFEGVLDLGTGSGCILLTLLAEMPGARGLGVDASKPAVLVAQRNAEELGLLDRAQMQVSDWYDMIPEVGTGYFDLIVSNPPYIAADEIPLLAPEVRDWEPLLALTDGADGLGAYRRILEGAHRFLLPEGRLILEIGPTQADEVQGIARAAGFGRSHVVRDLDGRERVIVFKPGRDVPF